MVHPLNQARKSGEFKKAGGAYVTRDELEEALAPILAALEVSDLDAAIDELDGLDEETQTGPDSETEKGRHFAESDPEGRELVEKIHEKKSRTKRKPEGQDPLGLVPDDEGADS